MTTAPLVGAGSNSNRTTWPPCRLQLAGYLHPSTQSPPVSWNYSRNAWSTVTGWGCCTTHVTAWRSSPSSAESSLLQPSPPLLKNVSLDARLATGGGHVIEGGGRLELRGGFTAHSPASTHRQLKKLPPRLSRLPPDKPSLQQIPRCRQQLFPRRRSQPLHLRRSVSRRSRHRHCRCHCWRHHRSQHPLHVNKQKQSVRRPGLVARPLSWPRKDRSLSSTDAFHRLLHLRSRLQVRWCPLRQQTLRHHQLHSRHPVCRSRTLLGRHPRRHHQLHSWLPVRRRWHPLRRHPCRHWRRNHHLPTSLPRPPRWPPPPIHLFLNGFPIVKPV